MKRFATYAAALAATLLAATALHAQDIAHRKADLTVQVQTGSGTPLEGATVEIEMLNHAFRFGTAVNIGKLEQANGQYDPKTVEEITKYFNSITFENAMKWGSYENSTPSRIVSLANLAKSYKAFNGPDDFRLRGHVTLWSQQMPNSARSLTDPDELNQRALDHVEAFHTTLKDVGIDSFDLYNEHMRAPADLIDKIVPSKNLAEQATIVAAWFNKAKEVDPNANLFVNDYNILNFWNNNDQFVVEYKEYIDAVRDAGGQIDGIGLQAHMDRFITKEQITRRLDLLAAPMAPTANHPDGLPGLRIEITELDINDQQWSNATDEQEAEVTQNVLEGAFEHPSVDGVTIWVINDGSHWRGNAILFDDSDPNNWVVKQSGQVWIDKVLNEWWQDHSGASATNGAYTANTFKGTHRVTVTFNGETKEEIVALDDDNTITVNFAAEAADAATYDAWTAFITWGQASNLRDADPDDDGLTNLDEYLIGSDPLEAAPSPTVPKIQQTDGNALSIDFLTRAQGASFLIEYSQNLTTWTPIDQLAWPDVVPTPQLDLKQTQLPNGQTRHTLELSNIVGFFRITLSEPSQS
ncbi:Glycosyl hydrolase family 10 protein [Verrucomicrobiia bacterium DG1235]|nr:Glycosyl hydrolase family 10 protein [Verrucomicrobiae bacterium DG1235]